MPGKFHFALLPLMALLALAGSAAAQDLDRLLAVDAALPLDVKVLSQEERDGVEVADVTFASVAGGSPTAAYVVRPASGSGPFAGVFFVHWFEPGAPTSNRTQYLDEAKALARRGTVSLLVSTFWSDAARYRARRWENDFQNSIDQARELRRGLDVLLAQPGVDPQRIANVGHDYGAMFGAILAATDPRPKAFALIAGTARFADWYLFGSASGVPKGEALETFRKQLALIDPVEVIGRSRAAILFQFGEKDRYTPRQDFVAFYLAAPENKRILPYSSDHPMEAEIIRFDRSVWLSEQLGLTVPPVPVH